MHFGYELKYSHKFFRTYRRIRIYIWVVGLPEDEKVGFLLGLVVSDGIYCFLVLFVIDGNPLGCTYMKSGWL